MKHWNSRY